MFCFVDLFSKREAVWGQAATPKKREKRFSIPHFPPIYIYVCKYIFFSFLVDSSEDNRKRLARKKKKGGWGVGGE